MTDAIPDPKAVLPRLPVFFAAIATALILAVSAATAQPAPDLDAWPNTDFENATVDLSEIISGGVGRDGIPAIDDPEFLPAAEETGLGAMEPVMTYAPRGRARASLPVALSHLARDRERHGGGRARRGHLLPLVQHRTGLRPAG